MQINVDIPRSVIRASRSIYGYVNDPFNDAVTNAIGAPAAVGYEIIVADDVPLQIKVPRSAKRAMMKYDRRQLDAPVRFRLTIPEIRG